MRNAADTAGIVVVDKPQGWTSHQVVGRLRRILGTRKVGHAGTLDPMATGVLVVGFNRATRLLGHLMLTEKTYTATMRLGVTTDTDDADGTVVDRVDATRVERQQIRAAMAPLTGEIDQVPSSVSAIKVDGRRAYERVRAGEEVRLRSRRVTVSRFDLLEVRPGPEGSLDADVIVDCSSGTYIRALARDVGAALGCGGHLVALRRTRVGPFVVEDAQVVDGDTDAVRVVPIDDVARRIFPSLDVDADAARVVANGGWLSVPLDGVTALFHDSRFLALYRPDGEVAVAEAVFC